MKYILTILFCATVTLCYSQYATKQYVDSLYRTIDSIVVKPTKTTATNNTIILDTLKIANNSRATFQIVVQTDSDVTIKTIYIKNVGGVYSIIDDYDLKPFSHNRSSGWFSSKIYYQVTSSIVNRIVVISAVGAQSTLMTWTLTRTRL